MGDHMMKKGMQARPRIELEELYQGIPDESVNLTFQYLANVHHASDKRSCSTMTTIDPISDKNSITSNPTKAPSPSPMAKLPSLDFSKGLQATNIHSHHLHHGNNHNHHQDFGHGGGGGGGDSSSWSHFGQRVEDDRGHDRFSHASEYSMSMGYDGMSGVSMASGKGGSGRKRRPGIPHSNICTACSTYIYLFRTRCLVCFCTFL